jgi:DNA-binding transcriptional ArsR family regulator
MGSRTLKHLLWYLIAATRGGPTRAKVIDTIRRNPTNANKIANSLGLDYRTIQHHLKILAEHNIITVIKKGSYGAVYFLSEEMDDNIELFEEIWNKIGK